MPQEAVHELWMRGISLLFTIIGAIVTYYLIPYLKAHVGVDRLSTIARLAREAYAFVEVQAPELMIKGKAKLAMAEAYMDARLAELGIPVTVDQLRAAIEEVWLEYNPDGPKTPE